MACDVSPVAMFLDWNYKNWKWNFEIEDSFTMHNILVAIVVQRECDLINAPSRIIFFIMKIKMLRFPDIDDIY